MLKMKKMLMFLLLLGGGLSGYSREHLDTASLAIYYRQGRSSFDAVYRNNGTRLDAFMERFRRLQGDTLCSLRYVHVVGGSSPEGGRAVNERLARLRARQMERRLESDIPLADSLAERARTYRAGRETRRQPQTPVDDALWREGVDCDVR